MTDLARNIKRLRTAQNLTQAQLGEKLGLPRESVIAWERADPNPDPDLLPAIAEALNTNVVTLLYPVEEQEEKPFRPGCGFVIGAVLLYGVTLFITGEWGIILGPVAFMAICTAMILEAVNKK